jgi:hypothetical protein
VSELYRADRHMDDRAWRDLTVARVILHQGIVTWALRTDVALLRSFYVKASDYMENAIKCIWCRRLADLGEDCQFTLE